ncbi:MAG: EamA family transporter [Anaerolineales bacterium]|nr:EamA family transporter [Anaerolineales bacterium]
MPGLDLTAAAVFGLLSAASWGAGDFCGGLAARRASAPVVVITSQVVGLLLLTGLALILGEVWPTATDLMWGALAGLAGNLGLLALYRALANGQMGVVAPLSAVLAAALPVLITIVTVGWPSRLMLAGFLLALAGVWLLAQPPGRTQLHWRDLGLPVAAGLGFGLFFVFIGQVGPRAVFWPLVASRAASVTLLATVSLVGRQRLIPALAQTPLMALSGVLDAAGNACFALAVQAGRLDVAAVLSSLYPASTVLLARVVLKERFTRPQLLGIAAALAAIGLISA